jgi:hypothetical protein
MSAVTFLHLYFLVRDSYLREYVSGLPGIVSHHSPGDADKALFVTSGRYFREDYLLARSVAEESRIPVLFVSPIPEKLLASPGPVCGEALFSFYTAPAEPEVFHVFLQC